MSKRREQLWLTQMKKDLFNETDQEHSRYVLALYTDGQGSIPRWTNRSNCWVQSQNLILRPRYGLKANKKCKQKETNLILNNKDTYMDTYEYTE